MLAFLKKLLLKYELRKTRSVLNQKTIQLIASEVYEKLKNDKKSVEWLAKLDVEDLQNTITINSTIDDKLKARLLEVLASKSKDDLIYG